MPKRQPMSGSGQSCQRRLERASSVCPLYPCGFNRSTQHLLILLDWEVSDGGECTDVVHAETAGGALGAMEERSMCGGHRLCGPAHVSFFYINCLANGDSDNVT